MLIGLYYLINNKYCAVLYSIVGYWNKHLRFYSPYLLPIRPLSWLMSVIFRILHFLKSLNKSGIYAYLDWPCMSFWLDNAMFFSRESHLRGHSASVLRVSNIHFTCENVWTCCVWLKNVILSEIVFSHLFPFNHLHFNLICSKSLKNWICLICTSDFHFTLIETLFVS